MEMEEIVNLALNRKYDEAFSELEKLPPRAMHDFWAGVNANEQDVIDGFYMHMSKEQDDKLGWLNSSQRITEYILSIPEEKRTDQDWADFRSANW